MLTTNNRFDRAFLFFFRLVTSNGHTHLHEQVHPHADLDTDLERIQRLAMFLESHFGEVHMTVPEPEKGDESHDEEGPEYVLSIRLDEADALVHLRSMVRVHFLVFFPSSPLHFPSSAMG